MRIRQPASTLSSDATRGGDARVRDEELIGDERRGRSKGLKAAGMVWEDGKGEGNPMVGVEPR